MPTTTQAYASDLVDDTFAAPGWWLGGVEGAAVPLRSEGPPPSPASPPPVTRGAECQTAPGVDWMTFAGPVALAESVRRVLCRELGAEPERGGQMKFYGVCESWRDGLVLLATEQVGGAESCCVQLGGEICGDIGPNECARLAELLITLGMHCTRVDCRNDYDAGAGGRVGLVDDVARACMRGELCGAEEVKPMGSIVDGCFRFETIYLGGRSSDKRVRIYDKGLESGERPAGEWERWEVQYRKERAHQAVGVIIAAWRRTRDCRGVLQSLALSAVEFKVAEPGVRRSRREVADWWAALCQGVDQIIVRGRRRAGSLFSYANHITRAVLPTVRTIADRTGLSLAAVLLCIEGLAESDITEDRRRRSKSTAVAQFVQWFRDGLVPVPA